MVCWKWELEKAVEGHGLWWRRDAKEWKCLGRLVALVEEAAETERSDREDILMEMGYGGGCSKGGSRDFDDERQGKEGPRRVECHGRNTKEDQE